jgi:uncharacterized protein involved in exopolysaccharide biosynthesis
VPEEPYPAVIAPPTPVSQREARATLPAGSDRSDNVNLSDNVIVQQMSNEQEKPIGEEIREIFRVLVGEWRTVWLITFMTLNLVILYIWISTPLYSSQVEILIDPRQRQTVQSEVIPNGLGADGNTLLLESQVEVLRSQKVTDALIRAENLTADPEFAGTESSLPIDLLKTIVKTVIYGPQQSLWQKTSAYDKTVNTLRKRMDVKRQRNTYVIGVTMQSSDSKKAARLANNIAKIYISEVNSTASSTTRKTATVLTSKLEELRRTANRTAADVETYKKKNNLIGTNETLVVEQQLSDLNSALSQARAELQSALARRNQYRKAISAGKGPALRLSEIGESTVMSKLQTRLAGIESKEADLKSVYLGAHPTLKRVQERKASLIASLHQESARILNRLDIAYKTALEKSSSLRADVVQLESQMAVSNSDMVQLRELEREAETSRTVYESFLRRSKEAWEQINIPKSTAQIISVAYAASRPSHPSVFLLLASGLVFGLSLGVIMAFLNHVLAEQPKRVGRSKAAPTEPVRASILDTLRRRQSP